MILKTKYCTHLPDILKRMLKTASKALQIYTIYAVLFLLYLACFIFVGFYFKVYINHWTLVSAFVSYVIIVGVFLVIKKSNKRQLCLWAVATILTPLLFWFLAASFGKTFDISYDGQDYHQTAVIALAEKWNPIYDQKLPFKPSSSIDQPIVDGAGKTIWSIDASIYKLTDDISSVTVINLLVSLLAFSLLYTVLKSLKIHGLIAVVLAFLAVFTTLFAEEVFSVREDSVSYALLIIALCSLFLILQTKRKQLYMLCLITALIFSAGTKDSNFFVLLPLSLLILYIFKRYKLYKVKSFKATLYIGTIAGILLFFCPYVTNLVRYHTLDYPYNETSFATKVRTQDIPASLLKDNRIELFFAGIFDEPQVLPALTPHPELPFDFTENDLFIEANDTAKVLGDYGVLFSGVFLISLTAMIYIAHRHKNKKEQKIFFWLCVGAGLVIISILLSPVPNYGRFSSQLYILPVGTTVALFLIRPSKWRIEKFLAVILIFFMVANIGLQISEGAVELSTGFSNINKQLTNLKDTHDTYEVYDRKLYSNIIRLNSDGIKTIVSNSPLKCKNKILLLDSYYGTTLCKVST